MKECRVVVTGLGAITSVGNSVKSVWKSLLSGSSGIRSVSSFDTGDFRSKIAGEVKNFDVSAYISRKEARRMDPFCHYAIAASKEAIDQSGLDFSLEDRTRMGSILSSGIGGITTLEKQLCIYNQSGPSRISPFLVPMMIGDMASGVIAIEFGLQGPNFGVVSACSTGSQSIGEAYWILKRGDADVMLCGGAEACISPICFAGFSAMKALSTRNDEPQSASRPFDAKRDGFVLAEGAGAIILETLDHAEKRSATIFGEVIGYSATADAYHITSPPPNSNGAITAIRNTLQQAKIQPNDIDYINAHGTGTLLNDKSETLAIKKVLGKRAYDIPISSTKSLTGHSLGATGAIESIVCIKAVYEDEVPGTYNLDYPDPQCDLFYVPNQSMKKTVQVALNLNFGFGGHNVVLAFRKYPS